MAMMFNANEVYQIGVEIEKNGKEFYREAAAVAEDPDTEKLFKDLSAWEESHVELFETLKRQLPAESGGFEVSDPDGEMTRYLKANADSHVFVINTDMSRLVQECGSPEEILKLAMRFEKDSVALYSSMKNLVPEDMGRETIDRLIQEELSHVSFLQARMESLGP
ncbi:MAG: ferritin-like domain-containing protein [Planctomycetota bacterium]